VVVRFQVDPDFYDHPKSIGMSDAAVALWTRAGSYSAAKLTDGFIAEHVLVTLSRTPEEAADELVRRGLWRRVKGGWRFHQWEQRNLTKARIEEDRAADRDRKKRVRAAARSGSGQPPVNSVDNSRSGTAPQVNRPNVRTESGRTPDGIQAESARIPGSSVSVSVSESVSGSGRGSAPPEPAGSNPDTTLPPPRCPDHTTDPNPPPCGRCAEARKTRERWNAETETERQRRLAEAPRCRRHRGQLAATCGPCRSERLAAGLAERTDR
jgi:hypothetical protein